MSAIAGKGEALDKGIVLGKGQALDKGKVMGKAEALDKGKAMGKAEAMDKGKVLGKGKAMGKAKVLDKKKVAEVVERLGELYGDEGTALTHGSVFELLVAVVLSAQTTDVAVNKVTPGLFSRWPDAASLAAADPDEVAGAIRAIGLYRTKAMNLVRLSGMLVEKYNGEVPGDFDALTGLPGVGRKTANVVLAFGFGEERMPVDTHVFRVANRIGLCAEATPEKTEAALVARMPEGRLSASHHYLIFHGRRACHARKPECAGCVIEDLCLYPGKPAAG